MKTERVSFVMSLQDKAEITRRAEELHMPASELIMRAIQQYEPDGEVDEQVLLDAAAELESVAIRTEQKLDEALTAVRETTAQLRQSRRAERGTVGLSPALSSGDRCLPSTG